MYRSLSELLAAKPASVTCADLSAQVQEDILLQLSRLVPRYESEIERQLDPDQYSPVELAYLAGQIRASRAGRHVSGLTQLLCVSLEIRDSYPTGYEYAFWQ